MGIQINGQTDTVTSTTAGGSVTVTPLAASSGLNVGTGASISSPATNVLTLGTNNVERVRVNAAGNVGIGTNIPAGQLDVRGSVYVDNNAVNLTYLTKSFSPSHVASSRGAKIRIGLDDGSFSGVEVENTVGNNGSYNSQNVHLINHDGGVAGDTYSLTARYDGRIGIGITNPLTKVHIQGTGNASSGSTGLSDSSSASALLLKPTIGSGTALALGTRATGGHYIQGLYAASSVDSVRDVQINPYGGSVGIGTFADAFGGVPGNSTFVVATTGLERLRIDSSGRVLMPYQPSFSVWLNGNQDIAHNTLTKVRFNAEVFDVGGNFDSSTNYRFTAPVAGKYLFMGHLYIYSTYQVEIFTYKNGSGYKRFSGPLGSGGNDNPNGLDFLDIIDLAVNDYVEIYGYQLRTGDSATISIYGGGVKESSFVGYLIG